MGVAVQRRVHGLHGPGEELVGLAADEVLHHPHGHGLQLRPGGQLEQVAQAQARVEDAVDAGHGQEGGIRPHSRRHTPAHAGHGQHALAVERRVAEARVGGDGHAAVHLLRAVLLDRAQDLRVAEQPLDERALVRQGLARAGVDGLAAARLPRPARHRADVEVGRAGHALESAVGHGLGQERLLAVQRAPAAPPAQDVRALHEHRVVQGQAVALLADQVGRVAQAAVVAGGDHADRVLLGGGVGDEVLGGPDVPPLRPLRVPVGPGPRRKAIAARASARDHPVGPRGVEHDLSAAQRGRRAVGRRPVAAALAPHDVVDERLAGPRLVDSPCECRAGQRQDSRGHPHPTDRHAASSPPACHGALVAGEA